MITLNKIKYMIQVGRKAKIYKKPLYEGIPFYHKPHYIDIHDGYKYRTKDQVMDELKDMKFKMKLTRHLYPEGIDLH